MLNPEQLQEVILSGDIIQFSEKILGMPLHEGHKYWFTKSVQPINILKPANQWGKTTAEAIKHIFHAVCKPNLKRFNMQYDDHFAFTYRTLNFGKTYEIAKGVMEAVIEIAEGRYLLPTGKYNESMLQGWAITGVQDAPKLPKIKWWNHAETLIRSYDGLGESFKRLRLAFISGDECGDIPELKLFVNGTLIPRLFFFGGCLDLVGTPQSKGVEYEDLAQTGEEEMAKEGDDARIFVLSYATSAQMASIYTNTFMQKERIQEMERISDPELRKQIIYGMYVDYGKHLYSWEEVHHMFDPTISWDPETGFSADPEPNHYYVFSVDMAAGDDETSCTCLEYNRKLLIQDEKTRALPHRIIYHRFWKGASIPLSLQYEIIKSDFLKIKKSAGLRAHFLYDAGSLGGKNTQDAFKELNGIPFPPKGRSYAQVKAEGMMKVKEVLGRGRKIVRDEVGKQIDVKDDWGYLKCSSQLKELRRQFEIASRDDDKLKNDQYTSVMQAVHFAEVRAIKTVGRTVVKDFNYLHRM